MNAVGSERRSRVLVVDDDPHDRALLEVMLAADGYDFESVISGEAALAAVDARVPDLILLDVMMPGMDGYQVVAQLKASAATKHVPVIMVTAADDHAGRLLGLEGGAEESLGKPVDRAELCMRVRNLLRLKAYGDFHDRYSQHLELEVNARTAALVESERLYRSTFDQAPVGIVHVGADGRWQRVNQRLCEMLGYTRADLEDRAIEAEVHTPELEELAALGALMSASLDRHFIAEKRYRRRDGVFVCARVNLSVHRDATGVPQHVIQVIEDITEVRALEAQLRQANKMDAVGSLASGVAHDFNNLLSVVLSYSELLSDGLKEGDPMRGDLDQIRRAGLRAADLTRQLLAFGRQQVLQPQVVDLTDIIGGMMPMLRRLIGEHIQMTTSGTSALGTVDPGQMEQVVMNLVINARDAMPEGGGLSIETSEVQLDGEFAATHVGVKAGPHVMLAVADTGIGMDNATQARMFEPFFTTKALGKGTGLGLSTVFGIVRQSGGTILVNSEPGKGTTFKVYLPAAASGHRVRSNAPPLERSQLRGSETILLVEDEERVRVLTRTILRKYGYVVLDAQNGGDALLLCEQHPTPIHMLLTDVVLPRMSGGQLAERLCRLRPAMTVLFMSGYTNDEAVHHGAASGAFEFLQKPITPEALAVKVRQTLDGATRAASA